MADSVSYRAVFTDDAVAFFARQSKRRQRVILDRARELVSDPFLIPDFQTTDGTGREIAHVLVDGFIFDFWVDHAAKQVVITEIDFVD